jgi:glycosyltransferase involved in cell wall biosynthesis
VTQERINYGNAFDPHVCHIISSFRPIIGGAERATENLCHELARLGVDIVVLTRHHRGLLRYERISGMPVHRLGLDGPRWFSAAAFVIHALAWICARLSYYSLVHVQNIDSPLLIGMLAKVLLRKKLVVTLHGEKTIILKKRMPLGKLLINLMTRFGDLFVALTDECHRQYLRERITSERVIDIPNGVDTERFCPPTLAEKIALREQYGFGEDNCVVLYAGRLVDLKRADLLIKAWGALPHFDPARCVIVGDGPERETLQTLVDVEGLGNTVYLVGAKDDVLPYYQMADIFVLPSLYEGLSVALLEAMSCGLCVIVAGSPGNLAVVEPGVNGLVFPVDKPELLKERLLEVLADGERRDALGQRARQRVRENYSIEVVALAHIKMYRNLPPARLRSRGDCTSSTMSYSSGERKTPDKVSFV